MKNQYQEQSIQSLLDNYLPSVEAVKWGLIKAMENHGISEEWQRKQLRREIALVTELTIEIRDRIGNPPMDGRPKRKRKEGTR